MAQLGWSLPAMFRRHNIVAQDDIAEGLERRQKFESEQRSEQDSTLVASTISGTVTIPRTRVLS